MLVDVVVVGVVNAVAVFFSESGNERKCGESRFQTRLRKQVHIRKSKHFGLFTQTIYFVNTNQTK